MGGHGAEEDATLRFQPGYDHGYFFVSSFAEKTMCGSTPTRWARSSGAPPSTSFPG